VTPASNALHTNRVGVQRPKAFALQEFQPRHAVEWNWLGPLSIAILATTGIFLYLSMRYVFGAPRVWWMLPLFAVLALGGVPLVVKLSRKLLAREFGSDLLAGISIVTSVILGEYLVGCVVVLMLSGGEALEQFATRQASSTLDSLAKRMPQMTHRKSGEGLKDVSLEEIAVGDELVIFPHEICPTDGVVLTQEIIDLLAVMNAVRVALPFKALRDF
jgi:cation transport ATPase